MKNTIRCLLTVFAVFAAMFLLQLSASASVTGIEIKQMPDKTVYDGTEDAVVRNETVWNEETKEPEIKTYNYYPIDFSGMVLTLTLDDNSTVELAYDRDGLTDGTYTVEARFEQDALHPWTEGAHTVSLQCAGSTITFEILLTHDEVADISLAKAPDKTRYISTDGLRMAVFDGKDVKTFTHYPIDLTGLELFVCYEDGFVERIAVSDSMRTLLGSPVTVDDGQTRNTPWNNYGTHTVTLSWKNKTVSFEVCTDENTHKVTTWTYNDDATHTGACVYCGEKVTEECRGGTASCKAGAVCTVCSHTYTKPLAHTWNYISHDKDGHKCVCTVCSTSVEKGSHTLYVGQFNTETGFRRYSCPCGYAAEGYAGGDLDLDGEITANDARTVLRCSVGLWELTDEGKYVADVDHNGAVEAADARLILRASVKLENFGLFGCYIMNVIK